MALNLEQALKEAKKAIEDNNKLRARRLYEKILEGFPDNEEARQALVNIGKKQGSDNPPTVVGKEIQQLMSNGEFEKALQAITKALRDYPNSHVLYNQKGICHSRLDQPRFATIAFNRCLEISSSFLPAIMGLGSLFAEKERYEPAIQQFKRALELDPNFGPANLSIARCYISIGHPFEGEKYALKAYETGRERLDVISVLANCYRDQDNLVKSREFFEKALKKNEENVGMRLNWSNTLTVFGLNEEASEQISKALELDENNTRAYRALSLVGSDKSLSDIKTKMNKLMEEDELSEEDLMHLHFAMGNVLTKEKKYDEAFRHFEDGNYARKSIFNYDIKNDQTMFSTLEEKINNIPNVNISTKDDSVTPIFVLGMMRSGTTLTEQIISSHVDVTPRGELEFMNKAVRRNINPNEEITEEGILKVRESYLDDINLLNVNTKYFTDKMPNNFRWSFLIREAFPDAKIVHTKRNPKAVCWSIYKNFFGASGNGFAYDLSDLVEFYNLYHRHMELVNKQYDGIYNLDYEAFVENPENEGQKLFDYLELDWNEGFLNFQDADRAVKTASTRQVREQVYKGSSLEWEKFEGFLAENFNQLPGVA